MTIIVLICLFALLVNTVCIHNAQALARFVALEFYCLVPKKIYISLKIHLLRILIIVIMRIFLRLQVVFGPRKIHVKGLTK